MKSLLPIASALLFSTMPAWAEDVWTALSNADAPAGREEFSTVWTGAEMIIWGGRDGTSSVNTGGRFNPATNTWTPVTTADAPSQRFNHSAVWTGQRMIVWGGTNTSGNSLNDGASYDPANDTWTPIGVANAPVARNDHRAVWTGTKMIVWGGYNAGYLNSGGIYDPVAETWSATTLINVPSVRAGFAAIWSGSEMIVFGGGNGSITLNTGGRYNPTTDAWTALPISPQGRNAWHQTTAIWTGTEMIIWGGSATGGVKLSSGARYSPAANSWTAMSTVNAPAARDFHAVLWTGSEMLVWSGAPDNGTNPGGPPVASGGRYRPATDSWVATSLTNTPEARRYSNAVWTGTSAIIWGGSNGGQYIGDTFAYQFWGIAVEDAVGTPIVQDGVKMFPPVAPASTTTLTFTIKNTDLATLNVSSISVAGGNASDFAVNTTGMLNSLPESAQTTFQVAFTPAASGARTTTLRIITDDPLRSPYDITLNGNGLSFTTDTDGDGLNDASEHQLSGLGFDWQVSQPDLVNSLPAILNAAGFYTPAQVQALHVGVPLVQRNPATGTFTLTIGVQKSANLTQFNPFPMTQPQTSINGEGRLEFQFTVPDNTAFFRLQAQ